MTPDDFDDDQLPVRDEHYEYETHLADDDYYGDLRYADLMPDYRHEPEGA